MSATPYSSSERYECDHCGDHAPAHTFYDAAMCSESCRREADTESVLNTLKHDHTICSTCYRRLKTIETPPERATSAAVGFQYRTPDATWGERQQDTGPDRDPRLPSADRQLYAYEVQTDDSDEIREYYPARKFDWANEPEPTPQANEPVDTGTVCYCCGNSEHNVPDTDLRTTCSAMLIGHHLTERLREASNTSLDEASFWDAYTRHESSIRDAVEAAVIS